MLIIGRGGHLVFPIGPKSTKLVEEVEILLFVKFRQIPLSGFKEQVLNVSVNKRPAVILFFPIGPKNTYLVEDVEFLLPVMLQHIPFSGFREEVKNVKNDGWTDNALSQ